MMKLLFASDEPVAPGGELTLDPTSPCSTTPASSPRNLADWATASTLVETADCVEPTTNPTTDAKPSDKEQSNADDNEDQLNDQQALPAAQSDGDPESPAAAEQSLEEQLAEQLSAVTTENAQLRAQLDKIHAMLTDQVKMMNDASACLTPSAYDKQSANPEPTSRWSMGAAGACVRKGLSDATAIAFTTPETKIGWVARSAVTVAGLYALGRYGKAPALKVAKTAQEMVTAAGSTMRDSVSNMKLTTENVPTVTAGQALLNDCQLNSA